jgi:hypothetical protein
MIQSNGATTAPHPIASQTMPIVQDHAFLVSVRLVGSDSFEPNSIHITATSADGCAAKLTAIGRVAAVQIEELSLFA